MHVLQAIILGLIQGLTEFIPVSSSGHLVLAHHFMGIEQNGLTFDVALHIGTLMALILFFWKDIVDLVRGLFNKGPHKRLVWLLIAATIPAVIVGVLLQDYAESAFRSPALVSINLMLFAGVMLAAEWYARRYVRPTQLENVTRRQALTIGCAQAAAIIPGVSRSGSTITTGLFLGMDRVAATRFSFLLGIPITAGAIAKVLISDSAFSQISQKPDLFAIGIITSFVSGIFAIRFLLRYLAKHSLRAFAYYRLALGACVLLLTMFSLT